MGFEGFNYDCCCQKDGWFDFYGHPFAGNTAVFQRISSYVPEDSDDPIDPTEYGSEEYGDPYWSLSHALAALDNTNAVYAYQSPAGDAVFYVRNPPTVSDGYLTASGPTNIEQAADERELPVDWTTVELDLWTVNPAGSPSMFSVFSETDVAITKSTSTFTHWSSTSTLNESWTRLGDNLGPAWSDTEGGLIAVVKATTLDYFFDTPFNPGRVATDTDLSALSFGAHTIEYPGHVAMKLTATGDPVVLSKTASFATYAQAGTGTSRRVFGWFTIFDDGATTGVAFGRRHAEKAIGFRVDHNFTVSSSTSGSNTIYSPTSPSTVDITLCFGDVTSFPSFTSALDLETVTLSLTSPFDFSIPTSSSLKPTSRSIAGYWVTQLVTTTPFGTGNGFKEATELELRVFDAIDDKAVVWWDRNNVSSTASKLAFISGSSLAWSLECSGVLPSSGSDSVISQVVPLAIAVVPGTTNAGLSGTKASFIVAWQGRDSDGHVGREYTFHDADGSVLFSVRDQVGYSTTRNNTTSTLIISVSDRWAYIGVNQAPGFVDERIPSGIGDGSGSTSWVPPSGGGGGGGGDPANPNNGYYNRWAVRLDGEAQFPIYNTTTASPLCYAIDDSDEIEQATPPEALELMLANLGAL